MKKDRLDQGKKFLLTFKDGYEITVSHIKTAWTLINYYYYSNKMGVYNKEDMIKLNLIASSINSTVDNVFSKDDFRLYFSDKEAILICLIKRFKPEVVVETGVAYGISSSAILFALQLNRNGRLISIDLPNNDRFGYTNTDGKRDKIFNPKNREPGWIIPVGLKDKWDLRLGKSSEKLLEIDFEIDMFLHDSDHSYENMMFEFNWANSHLKLGGLLSADDISWNDAFSDFEKQRDSFTDFMKTRNFGILKKTN